MSWDSIAVSFETLEWSPDLRFMRSNEIFAT
jgi:hypothetical protein